MQSRDIAARMSSWPSVQGSRRRCAVVDMNPGFAYDFGTAPRKCQQPNQGETETRSTHQSQRPYGLLPSWRSRRRSQLGRCRNPDQQRIYIGWVESIRGVPATDCAGTGPGQQLRQGIAITCGWNRGSVGPAKIRGCCAAAAYQQCVPQGRLAAPTQEQAKATAGEALSKLNLTRIMVISHCAAGAALPISRASWSNS